MSDKIYITGKVEGIGKVALKELIQPEYSMASGVTKSLKYLVTALKPGAKRLEQARDYGIKVSSWEEFVKLAGFEERVERALG